MVNSSAGQRAVAVHARGRVCIGGAELIYDSQSKSDENPDNMNITDYKKR
jgi:hypothetical protein